MCKIIQLTDKQRKQREDDLKMYISCLPSLNEFRKYDYRRGWEAGLRAATKEEKEDE